MPASAPLCSTLPVVEARPVEGRRPPPVAIHIPILLYHSIADASSEAFRSWTVPPSLFAAHMQVLRSGGYTPITVERLSAILGGADDTIPARPVVLTFDDGFADFYEHALPVLADHQFASTLYITTGYIGGSSGWLRWEGEGDRRMLTWPQVREAAASGVEIGAHSHRHPHLDTLSRRAAWDEIFGPKLILEDRIGQAVETFAYPHGYNDGTVRQLVELAGYRAACGVKHALSSLADDRFSLARIIVTPRVDADRLAMLLQGVSLAVAPLPDRALTRGCRLARRAAARLRLPMLGVHPLGAGGDAGDSPLAAMRGRGATRRNVPAFLAQALYEATAPPGLRRGVNALRHSVNGREAVAHTRESLPAILARLADALGDSSMRSWGAQRLTYTESAIVVALIGPARASPRMVAKVAATPAATANLRRQTQALERLREGPLVEAWQGLTPRIVFDETIGDLAICVESAMRGEPQLEEMADPIASIQIQLQALDAIDVLHQHNARTATVDTARLERWVSRPVELIRRVIGADRRLARVGEELRERLTGQPVVVTFIHGDFWPGNLLFERRDITLTGVIDWDLAADDELPIHDVLNLLLSAQAILRGRDLGSLVGARLGQDGWSSFERYALDKHAASTVASAIPERSLLLLYWLRYVATYIEKSPAIADDAWWISRNIDSVLRRIRGTAARCGARRP